MDKMKSRRSRGKSSAANVHKKALAAFLGVLLVAATLALAGPAAAQVYPWWQANANGFGIGTPAHNTDALDMVVHDGQLYAGTGNDTEGGQVWRYDADTTWTQVNENGFGVPVPAHNTAAHTLAEFDGDMYCATWNTVDGLQVWRYDTGTSWTKVSANGFGIAVPAHNVRCDDMAVLDDHLYAATANGWEGGQVWRYDGGTTWTQVNLNGFGVPVPIQNPEIWSLAVHDSKLYAGTLNGVDGCQVWRYDGGTHWTQVNEDGFGVTNPTDNYAIHNMTEWNGDLYATARNDTGCQVWRYGGGTAWTRVSESGFGIAHPANSVDIWSMAEFGGRLYAAAVNGTDGCQLYRYEDGVAWTQVNEDGFGISHPERNYAVHCMVNYNDRLFAGTLNNHDGCQVWAGKVPGAWTWYLAEGSTGTNENGSFETWVVTQNPGDEDAHVRLYYQTLTEEIAGPAFTMKPHTRATRNVGDVVPNQFSVSTRVVSDKPVVAERAMYWSTVEGVNRQAATDSIGFDP
jgi:hypothetical protein